MSAASKPRDTLSPPDVDATRKLQAIKTLAPDDSDDIENAEGGAP
jgi:hypothetical protein